MVNGRSMSRRKCSIGMQRRRTIAYETRQFLLNGNTQTSYKVCNPIVESILSLVHTRLLKLYLLFFFQYLHTTTFRSNLSILYSLLLHVAGLR